MSYAAVPLYSWFCRTTGFGGTPLVSHAAPAQISERRITVRFDANIGAGLPWRFELFPRPVFRRAWEALDARLEPRKACRVYVGLLHLAAMHGCEAALGDHLTAVLDAGGTPDLEAARAAVAPPVPTSAPAVSVPAPDLAGYHRLLTRLGGAA